MDTYGWVSIQPSKTKQAILWTGLDFNVFFSGVLQFQLVQSLTCHWTQSAQSIGLSPMARKRPDKMKLLDSAEDDIKVVADSNGTSLSRRHA